jgi:hypothetical protein
MNPAQQLTRNALGEIQAESLPRCDEDQLRSAHTLRIAVGNKSRVGKDTFADRVTCLAGGSRFAFASRLYDVTRAIQAALGVPTEKDPALLQTVGTMLRTHYSPDIFVRATMDAIDAVTTEAPWSNLIVTDLRQVNEFEALKKDGFVTVRVVRADRVIDRDPNHSTETELDNTPFDYVITNDGTMDEYIENIDAVVAHILLVRYAA